MIKPFAITLLFSLSASSVADCHSLRNLAWLKGKWLANSNQNQIHETWREVSPQTYEGKAWTLDEHGELASQESLRLVNMENQIFYLAKVAHNTLPTSFKATMCSPQRVEFVNLNHDFPNSIEYRLVGNEIHVRVEDLEGKGFQLKFAGEN